MDRVDYAVVDAAGKSVVDGHVDLGDDSSTISLFLDLPAAGGYVISMSAEAGDRSCSAEQAFDVSAGATTEVELELECPGGSAAGVGSARVTATLGPVASCPNLEIVSGPLQASVGNSIALQISAGHEHAVRWSASSGSIDDPDAAEALFTCTEPGPVTLTLTSTGEGCDQSRSVEVTCVETSDTADACEGLGSTCHPVDPGDGPLHECHEVGHSGDQAQCAEQRAECIQGCGEALCQMLGSLCHEVDPGSGPLHECHELGHAGDAQACFEGGRECYDLCTAAHEARAVPVTLTFAAKVGEEDFACGQSYEGVGSPPATVQPQDFRFFIHDVRLVTTAGEEVPLALDERTPWQTTDVALLDFETPAGLCFNGDAATNAVVTGTVPPGEYTGVAFKSGVPESLNHADPATLPAPLQAGGMTWGWLLGFRFMRAELAGPSQDAGAGLGLLHAGSSACTGSPQDGTVTCANPNRSEVRLSGFDTEQSVIVADIGALFSGTDLTTASPCHSSGEACAPMFERLGVDLESGQPLETQSVFRLE